MKAKHLLFFLVIIFSISFSSCKKEHQYQANATLTGYDPRECVCCGGLKIVIENHKPPSGTDFYLVEKMPDDFKIGDPPIFPIAVKIDYQVDTAHCFGNWVIINRIARR